MVRKRRCRGGFSFLELQVAFVVFGIALSGLGPLVVMQLRQMEKLDSRFSDKATHYLVPSSDPWARRLGAVATIQTEDVVPAPGTESKTDAVNEVEILSIEKLFADEDVTAHVTVTTISKEEGKPDKDKDKGKDKKPKKKDEKVKPKKEDSKGQGKVADKKPKEKAGKKEKAKPETGKSPAKAGRKQR